MSVDSPTLPTGALPHPAMDYAALRAEGLALLGRLAGGQWTDFNAHDPGITLLEQLCWAMTDLGYRASFPMADLLAASSDPGLPGPSEILTCDPVTPADLRKVVLDLGLGAARVDAAEPPFSYFHHASSAEVRLVVDPGDPDASPIRPRGVHRVLVRTTEELSGEAALAAVATRVHTGRLVGEDCEVGLLETAEVWVGARLEVGPVDDPVALLAEIVERIQDHLAPAPRFTSLADHPDARTDALYEGPRLRRGFLADVPLPPDAVYASDLLHVMMDVPQVRAVRSLELAGSATGVRQRWVLAIPRGAVARLASDSTITLLRAGLPLKVDPAAVRARLEERRRARSSAVVDAAPAEEATGRRRALATHRSLQRQLPAAYGVGLVGLPASAPARRRAQARQLSAYLLVFDQLLANAFAQLAHAHELLSPAEGTRTYFAQPPEDPPIDIQGLVRMAPDAFRAWLDAAVEPGDPVERRKRFLAHLLARFAEDVGDHARVGGEADPDAVVVADRRAFLRDVARLGGARGSGWDVGTGAAGGLEDRLRRKIGKRRFHLIEHVLLRPVAEDAAQRVEEGDEQIPLLAGVTRSDPWSLQVTYVFEDDGVDADVEQLVAQTLAAETPAHVRPELLWFGGADWDAIDAAWTAFRAELQAFRAARLSGTASDVQLRFRDARDRVVDTLGLGRTWPLRDIPLPEHVIVPPGTPAEVPLGFSQRGVRYELRHRETGAPILRDGQPIVAEGTGSALSLPTPPIEDDVSYRVLAVKLEGADTPELRRETWIRGTVRVEEGVDPSLVAQIRLPTLDASVATPRPSDARIADYGVAVEVEILASQEGVVYELVDEAEVDLAFDAQTPLSASVVGTSGTIVLTLPRATEDVDLRVRGSKNVGDPQNPQRRTATLDVLLPLRVRANPAAEAALVPPIVDHGGAGKLEVRTTQRSVRYQAWARATRDAEFVYAATGGTIDVADGDRTIRVLRPDAGAVPAGFAARGDEKPGNGQKVGFALGTFDHDTTLLVAATKQHALGPIAAGSATLATVVQLTRALVQLVRPDPDPGLRLRVTMQGDATTGPWVLLHGQAGVGYRLLLDDAADTYAAYFHQRDDQDPGRNKGVGQLRVEVDLAVVADSAVTDRAADAPPTPTVEHAPVKAGTRVSVRARKAMSGLEADLARTTILAAVPAVRVDVVTAGAPARVVVVKSAAGERYTLLANEGTLATSEGTGEDLAFDVAAPDPSAVYLLAVTRDEGLDLERRAPVAIGG